MKALVTSEGRYYRCDGQTWGPVPYSFWTRYLEVFDEVVVMARVMPADRVEPQWQRVDGRGVSIFPLPHYLGPWQYLARRGELGRAVAQAAWVPDVFVLRVPSQLVNRLWPLALATGRPCGLEVVGDPWDVFAPGAVTHPLSPFFRRWFARQMRKQCVQAGAVSYVTREQLQRRYPASPGVFTTHYSSIELGPEAFAPAPRPPATGETPVLISVLSFAQMYKAPDVMIRAVASLIARGRNLKLVMIGDGVHLEPMRQLAASLGAGAAIEFRGRLQSGPAVRDELDRADLFLLPSRTEGLPRAIIEAMARGLPCIGSTVGGIPELLPADDLVPPGDHAALAEKISSVLNDPARRVAMSARNLAAAADYREEILRRRRNEFYRAVRDQAPPSSSGQRA